MLLCQSFFLNLFSITNREHFKKIQFKNFDVITIQILTSLELRYILKNEHGQADKLCYYEGLMNDSNSVSQIDFVIDADGRYVFTRSFHLRRGFCCGSGCRHCPYNRKRGSRKIVDRKKFGLD